MKILLGFKSFVSSPVSCLNSLETLKKSTNKPINILAFGFPIDMIYKMDRMIAWTSPKS